MNNLHSQLRNLILILVLAGISSCTHPHEDHALSEKIDTLFAEWNNSDSPGCALGVIQNGDLIYKQGYGMADLEHNISITPNSVFNIASVSKQFVAMSLLLLEEEGKLSFDDNIRIYLPELPEYFAPITIRNLIHHTSGIPDYELRWNIEGKDFLNCTTEDELYKQICSQEKLDFKPGEKHQYSNSGYFLAGLIVKRASGKSLKDFAEEKIFKPLGMKNSLFLDDNRTIIKNRAFGYAPLVQGRYGNAVTRFDLVGDGGLYTNVEDLFLWDQNFYNNKLGKGTMALIDKMLTTG
jgi:CubicO group peptidase (beta-lactamase class C family)